MKVVVTASTIVEVGEDDLRLLQKAKPRALVAALLAQEEITATVDPGDEAAMAVWEAPQAEVEETEEEQAASWAASVRAAEHEIGLHADTPAEDCPSCGAEDESPANS